MPITRRKFIAGGFLLTSGMVLGDALWFERFFLETNEFYIGTAAKDTSNIKLIQISDLHLRSISYMHKQLAHKVNRLKPDIIVFTGDSIDRRKNLPLLDRFLELIDKNITKVAILGNWEHWKTDLNNLKGVYDQHNCKLLVNQSEQLSFHNKTISITGVDDFIGGYPDIDAALEQYRPSDYHIILNHCPQYTDVISTRLTARNITADFVLSGHTHGGQVNLFGYAPILPAGSGNYLRGWYDAPVKMYVSKGIGTNIIPVRIGSRAEISIFNLKA